MAASGESWRVGWGQGGVSLRVGSGRGGSVREKNVTRPPQPTTHPPKLMETISRDCLFQLIPANSGKTPETLSELFPEFPSRERLGCPKPYNLRQAFEGSRAFPAFSTPPARRGTRRLFFSEVVSERASQSWSWNSQQHWGYFWEVPPDSLPQFNPKILLRRFFEITSQG